MPGKNSDKRFPFSLLLFCGFRNHVLSILYNGIAKTKHNYLFSMPCITVLYMLYCNPICFVQWRCKAKITTVLFVLYNASRGSVQQHHRNKNKPSEVSPWSHFLQGVERTSPNFNTHAMWQGALISLDEFLSFSLMSLSSACYRLCDPTFTFRIVPCTNDFR